MSIVFQCRITETCQCIKKKKTKKKSREKRLLFDLGSFESIPTWYFLCFIFIGWRFKFDIVYCYREINGRAFCVQVKHRKINNVFCDMYISVLFELLVWRMLNALMFVVPLHNIYHPIPCSTHHRFLINGPVLYGMCTCWKQSWPRKFF